MKRWTTLLLACILLLSGMPSVANRGTEAVYAAPGSEAVSENASGTGVSSNAPAGGVSANAPAGGGQKEEVTKPDKPKDDKAGNDELKTESPKDEEPEEDENDPKAVRILFIGNSFTRLSDDSSVPEMLKRLKKMNGKKAVIRRVSRYGAKLSYFCEETKGYEECYDEVVNYFRQVKWDYIVLQENSMVSLFAYEARMKPAVQTFQKMVHEMQPKAKLLLYMTPGYELSSEENLSGRVLSVSEMTDRLGASYSRLGSELGIEVVYAGNYSARVAKHYPKLALRIKDDKHPTQVGYYIVALAFYKRIFGQTPTVDAAKLGCAGLSQSEAQGIAGLVRGNIKMKKRQITLKTGAETTLKVTGDADVDLSKLSFSSLDGSVASVDKNSGRVKAVTPGVTTIVAKTSDGLAAYCMVTVTGKFTFVRREYVVGVGETVQILPANMPAEVSFSSSNKRIAVVNSKGVVRAKRPGKTVIKVKNKKNKSQKASYTLYVSLQRPENLSVALSRQQASGKKYAAYKISWKKSSGATGYRIYRSYQKNALGKLIGQTKRASFVDQKAKSGYRCYYRIIAEYNKREQCSSEPSEYISAYVPKPLDTTVKRGKKKTTVSFTRVKGAEEYLIYRSASKDGTYKYAASVKKAKRPSYTVKRKNKKIKYYYKVIARTKRGTGI